MFASRALTGSERNYQNLERECLATIWGMEKFHYFLYGKEFMLETDQKPLVSIYKKHMVEISPRIQRLILRSFPYQPIHVRYRKGMEIPLADAPSRVTPLPMEEDGIKLPIIAVNQVTANIPCSSNDLDQICVETRKDPTIKLLIHYISNGWPCNQRQLPQELHLYWNFREDLSVEDGIATKGSKVLMPSTPQRKALEQIHEGHQGVEKFMLKARESVFWPGISDDIWETVEKCGIFQSTSRASKPVGNISEIPPHPWHTLSTDLFYWNRINFLVVGDYYTKCLIVRKLPNGSTHVVIKELGMVFTEVGWPFILRSDNGPCYSSRELEQFLEFYQIHHTTTSPHHLQSNGFAEALVGILKKLMEKSIKDGKPWNYGLLQYRVTPISSTIPSPLEALTGRKLRTSLLQIPLTIGKFVESSWICQELIKCQPSTSTKYSMELKPGQPVFMKEVHGNVWKTGVIDQPAKEPDSYWIKFPDSSILRRTQVIAFSFQVGNPEQGVEQFTIYSLKCIQEFPNNAPRHRATSLTDRRSGYTSIPWKRNIIRDAEHSYQFLQFLWCTTFHFSEEISPFYQGCSTKKILSIQDLENPFGTLWNTVEGVSFRTVISSGYFFPLS